MFKRFQMAWLQRLRRELNQLRCSNSHNSVSCRPVQAVDLGQIISCFSLDFRNDARNEERQLFLFEPRNARLTEQLNACV